jgi:hypothetical protein
MNEYDTNWCTSLLADLAKWRIAAPFRVPVDPERENADNYYDVIKHPMDFQTMKRKLSSSKYRNTQEFINDIQLICDNAKAYNGPVSLFTLVCDDLMAEVKRQYSEKSKSLKEEWYKSLVQTTQALEDHLKEAPPGLAHLTALLEPPDVNLAQLPLRKREQIQRTLGDENLKDLRKNWLKLSESVRRQIMSVVNAK